MQIEKSLYARVHVKVIPWIFIYGLSTHVWKIFVYKHTKIIQCVKSGVLRKVQTLWVNNWGILRIKNAKFSGYYFYMN